MAKNKTANGHIKSRSRTMSILAQYFSNKMAVFCAGVIVVLVLMAIFVPIFSKYSYTDVDYTALYATPSAGIGLAVIRQAVIC